MLKSEDTSLYCDETNKRGISFFCYDTQPIYFILEEHKFGTKFGTKNKINKTKNTIKSTH